ncbi:MAG: hypothetical protein RIS29_1397 [Bacteroidota bacterium]|jgi:hypothetical protein
MKKSSLFLLAGLLAGNTAFADVQFRANKNTSMRISPSEAPVVQTAQEMLSSDFHRVFNATIDKSVNAEIIAGTLGKGSLAEKMIPQALKAKLMLHSEAFALYVSNNKLYILGSDKRGTAYGLLELSRMMGVSPWEWWADSPVAAKTQLKLAEGWSKIDFPSVAHRGIFLNDEDWGLTPWSYKTNEPSDIKGQIGPKTHARIFELLLRLRANTFWPAMHSCSVAYYLTPGNREVAEKYGISIGTSHCEPMSRNTNAEWKTAGTGEYNYVENRENVVKFWEERIKEVATSDNMYTLGIRGVHDGKMEGAKTVEEMKAALTNVLKDQHDLIAKYINKDVSKVPQVFIPYKEVLDVYNAGLEVPDYATLMWCDDNYGYITHFPNEKERARKGGNGVYYHVSYWGRPHDYLWLATTHPALLYSQMKMAYDKGAKDLWIVNVGDIKPAEYLTELFLDMAWNIKAIEPSKSGLDGHLKNWLGREFGFENADALLDVMAEYYRLAYIHKPEFMGNTRTEETDPKYKMISDLPWSEAEIMQRINDYNRIENKVLALAKTISADKKASWFQLIEYPVCGASQMNKKQLYAQLARHHKAEWMLTDRAYDSIASLTETYNNLSNGKWKYMMDMSPRHLSVFDKAARTELETPLNPAPQILSLRNGVDYLATEGAQPLALGLGYQRGAVHLAKNAQLSYKLDTQGADTVDLEITLAPNHPVEGKQIRLEVVVDKGISKTFDLKTKDRNEEWKMNVLNNKSTRTIRLIAKTRPMINVDIRALDEGIVIDQLILKKK